MRKIKFRTWDKEEKKMNFNPICYGEDFCCIVNTWIQEDKNKILMQYTGIKDKNGREIFMGDIVNSSVFIDDKEYNEISEVYYKKTISGFPIILEPFTSDDEPTGNFWAGTTKYEVIGNIYENPELLK